MRDMQELEPSFGRRGMSPMWAAVGLIGALIMGLLGYSLTSEGHGPQPGDAVPVFQLTSLDGTPISLGDYRGQVVVLNFFASWCPPCRDEARDLEQTWRKVQNQGVQFVGIAFRDTSTKVRSFVNEFQITYPCALDPRNRTARNYGVTGVPETFVVDPEGRLVHHFVGPITESELSLVLEQVFNRLSLP